jgi:hypothetical protein
VGLAHSNWQKHLASGRHPEVASYLGGLPRVLAEPDFVIEAPNQAYHYYRRGLGRGRFANAWLVLVVVDHRGQAMVVTWRFMFRMDFRGVQRWPRPTR